MGHEHRNLAFVPQHGAGNLSGGQHQATRGVEHQIQRHFRLREMNGAEDFFAVVNVYVPKDRKTQETHCFLAMHKQDHPGLPLSLDAGDQSPSRSFKQSLFDHRLQRREHQK